jgi:hypothetical protein
MNQTLFSGCRSVAVSRRLSLYGAGRCWMTGFFRVLIYMKKTQFLGVCWKPQEAMWIEWGARGRRFESFHADHMNQGLRAETL